MRAMLAQVGGRNPDKAELLRQPHKGLQAYIGVIFADRRARACKKPTGCAFQQRKPLLSPPRNPSRTVLPERDKLVEAFDKAGAEIAT